MRLNQKKFDAVRATLLSGEAVSDVAKQFALAVRDVTAISAALRGIPNFRGEGDNGAPFTAEESRVIENFAERPSTLARRAALQDARQAHAAFLASHGIAPPPKLVIVPDRPDAKPRPVYTRKHRRRVA